ncbi:thioredoxin domain-containing protein [Leucobacter sp. CSA2]|uniref:Thioredoxin domain-containing protein n=1 Tax=Leucobacter edaphi TaxID=2796472 RepID=A0A934QC98_9MICO|nr:thioredoxin domain-containing protein [Leucobacter edaphi]MBK0420642.1 thioredoxin domain-containing protein [Leucobacter edaphi]
MNTPAPQTWWSAQSASTKTMIIVVPTLLLLVGVLILVTILSRPGAPAVPERLGAADTVAENSHYIDEAGSDAPTLVEFLDIECEACGALAPYIDEVRKAYSGEINVVVRYFPLDGHANSMTAALAVEAAAQQGKFEEMLAKMLATQSEWGEQQASEAERFRGYAEAMKLDLAAYDAAVADPKTLARIEQDRAAGNALGVTGTPTFFLDGEKLELTGPDDLPDALDRALSRTK